MPLFGYKSFNKPFFTVHSIDSSFFVAVAAAFFSSFYLIHRCAFLNTAMLITDLVHKRDFTRELVSTNTDFQWLQAMKFYFVAKEADPFKCCVVKMANAEFFYGFEYLGIQEKLVQTPLTDRCYLTMTQALHSRLGGGPFGPAGTDITESVKALGQQLGRFVLVFNCDETFDFQAVGRILVALCQVGAWSCFDDINLMEERMLSAVSQQIQTIQENVRAGGDSKITIV